MLPKLTTQRLFALLTILLLAGSYYQLAAIRSDVATLDSRTDTLDTEVTALTYNQTSPTGTAASHTTTTVPLLTYDTATDSGRVVPVTVGTLPGNGTYIRIDSLNYHADFQSSIRTARQYVMAAPEYQLPYHAVFVTLDSPDNWEYIEGRSAGLSLTLGLAATHPGMQLNDSVAMTGTLNADGSIGAVERVPEKARAARDAGYDVFLVPPHQHTDVAGITVHEVDTIDDAATYALTTTSNTTTPSFATTPSPAHHAPVHDTTALTDPAPASLLASS